MDKSDKALLVQYRKGRVDALETLVEKYRRPLFGFIINMTGGQAEADEIFQEVWLRVIRKIDLYKPKNFFGWLVRIARNIIIDQARRRKPDLSLDETGPGGRSMAESIPEGSADPSRMLDASELGRRIAQATATLPDDQKEVFVLRVQADMPFKEIAAVQGVSINTVLARMQYALAKLRPLLKEEYENVSRK